MLSSSLGSALYQTMVPGVERVGPDSAAVERNEPVARRGRLKVRYSIGFDSDTLVEIASGQGSLGALALG
jgi:hypothetical protein